MHAIILTLLAGLAAPPKLAVAPLDAGDGTTRGMVELMGESIAAELRRQQTFQVLTYDELRAVLNHEELEQLLGCSDAKCLATAGDAAGADALLTGSLGKVGQSWIIALKIIDVGDIKVVAAADRRAHDGTVDDILDELPGLAAELVEMASRRRAAKRSPGPTPAAAGTSTKRHPLPSARKDVAFADAEALEGLKVVTDGNGHHVAFAPKSRYQGPLFAGTKSRLYAQVLHGGGAKGDKRWSAVFWDPRVPSGAKRQFVMREGAYSLHCGEHVIELQPLAPERQAHVLGRAKFLKAPWQRTAKHIARDDMGNFYFADRARSSPDYRVFVGRRGDVAYLPVQDAIVDHQSAIFITERGRLIFKGDGAQRQAWWAVGQSKQALTPLSLYRKAAMIYTRLGAYAGQALGSACDPYLGD